MREFWDDYGVPSLLGAFLVVLLCFAIWAGVEDSNRWSAFKAAHRCKVIGRISGDVVTTITTGGSIGVGVTPDKTDWACDDGMTYWR